MRCAAGSYRFKGDPFQDSSEDALDALDDGLGRHRGRQDRRPSATIPLSRRASTPRSRSRITSTPSSVPGFVDTHVHYPQMQMIGAYGEQLLAWLDKYTFVTEAQFVDKAHADSRSPSSSSASCCAAAPRRRAVLLHGCIHNPSTRSSKNPSAYGTLMVAGKVLMDRNAPDKLLDTAQRGFDESEALIQRWHGRGRNKYCVTPRFAPTSTEAQLDAAGALLKAHGRRLHADPPQRERRRGRLGKSSCFRSARAISTSMPMPASRRSARCSATRST